MGLTDVLLLVRAHPWLTVLVIYGLFFLALPDRVNRLYHLLIGLDQWLFGLGTFGVASPDETASAAAYRLELEGKVGGRFRPLIDAIFRFSGAGHCKDAYDDELLMRQLPKLYRQQSPTT